MPYILNETREAEVASRITLCESTADRTRGLLGTRRLDPGHVYWIRPCNSIHTFFMLMTIDVAFVDADLKVIKLIPSMTPFRVCLPVRSAAGVLEGAEGMIEAGRLHTGDQLQALDAT